jgi:hypothetical protein
MDEFMKKYQIKMFAERCTKHEIFLCKILKHNTMENIGGKI